MHCDTAVCAGAQVLERTCGEETAAAGVSWIHTKCLYQLSDESRQLLKGVTDGMCKTSKSLGSSRPPEPPRGPEDDADAAAQESAPSAAGSAAAPPAPL